MKMNDLLTFLNKISHRPSQIFHYEREILRHRNQLQYIARKSIRMPSPISFQKSPHISTKNPSQTVQSLRNLSPLLESSIVLYLVYRIRHENVHFTSLWSELESFLKIYFTSKQTDKGTGLGLAVVDGIVKKHKGFIKTYSKVGTGSTFQVFWPAIGIDVSL